MAYQSEQNTQISDDELAHDSRYYSNVIRVMIANNEIKKEWFISLCRAVAAERGRVMSGGSGRTRPRHVGRWRPNAAAPCWAVAAARGRVMSGSGGRTRPRHVGQAVAAAGGASCRPGTVLVAAATCRVALNAINIRAV